MADPTLAESFTQLGHAANLLEFLWDNGQNAGTNLMGLIDSYEQALEGNRSAQAANTLASIREQYGALLFQGTQLFEAHIFEIARKYNVLETDVDLAIDGIYDAMEDNSHTVKERADTRDTSPTAGGGNTGTGTVYRCVVDANNHLIEAGFLQQVRFECVLDKNNGGLESGSEEFDIYGVGEPNEGPLRINTAIPLIGTTTAKKSQDSIINNASFDSYTGTGASTSAITDWTAASGAFGTEIQIVNAAAGASAGEPYRNTPGQTTGSMVKLTAGTCELQQKISVSGNAIDENLPLLYVVRYFKATGVDATLQAKMGSQTATLAAGAATDDAWTDWNPFGFDNTNYYKNFRQDDVGFSIGLSAYVSGDWYVDELIVILAEVFDGIPFVVTAGATDWLQGDTIDFTDSAGSAGEIQYWMARLYGRYLPHASAAETYSDV